MTMEFVLSLGLGVGLAAACGIRVFLPVLVMGLAARAGFLELGAGFEWMAETPALLTLAAAVVFEIGAAQAAAVTAIMAAVGFRRVALRDDYGGRPRCLVFRRAC